MEHGDINVDITTLQAEIQFAASGANKDFSKGLIWC